MLSLRRGRVSAVVERHDGLVRLEVDGVPCVAYPDLTGPVALDDDVVVNVQARELGLGSGGFDVLHANLTRGLEQPPAEGAHVMKLPYTPVQTAVRHAEEAALLAETLAGMPVVCCSLHSQVAPVCAALAGVRLAYLQLPGGALPVALSDTIRTLRERGLVETTIGVDACFGGDHDCVNVYSALAWAAAAGLDAVVCAIGPGVVGTGSRFGHGGMAAAAASTAAAALDGRPVLVARVSEADRRPRHRGVSHHTEAIRSVAPADVARPWPAGCPFPAPDGSEVVDVSGWREACEGFPLAHMGRGPDDDPWFFAAAFAAGISARQLLD